MDLNNHPISLLRLLLVMHREAYCFPDNPPKLHELEELNCVVSSNSASVRSSQSEFIKLQPFCFQRKLLAVPYRAFVTREEFLNHIELPGIPSDKLRLKFGVPKLSIRNLDIPRLRNGTRFQITPLGPKAVLAADMTGIARGESAKFHAFR
ncbi:hypothetical protein AVEN_39546-1 [Araneus ventricosus]|uniref:DNA helicase Pif1-like 2B domain-containing protein n=1 Tax=Araneus ventricosus TaxID=182803 RepID=A0A4Y2LIN6_ARAVE|nr:hypothetical protein AVEN_39546-1 [Araneus ventricosus]